MWYYIIRKIFKRTQIKIFWNLNASFRPFLCKLKYSNSFVIEAWTYLERTVNLILQSFRIVDHSTVSERFKAVSFWRRSETIMKQSKTFMKAVTKTIRNCERWTSRNNNGKRPRSRFKKKDQLRHFKLKNINKCCFFIWKWHF